MWNSQADVRNGICADETAAIYFAFWRHLASFPLQQDDCIFIRNAILSKTTDGSPKITSQSATKIEVCFLHIKFLLHALKKPQTLNSLVISCDCGY